MRPQAANRESPAKPPFANHIKRCVKSSCAGNSANHASGPNQLP